MAYGAPVHMQCITCMGPKAAPLLHFSAAPVADPSSITAAVDVAEPSTTTAVAVQPPAAAARAAKRAAMDRISATALQLARELRKPKAWIGYVAFVLFALMRHIRLQMWEGANKFCVKDTFAPWAKPMCTNDCPFTVIPCALKKNIDGVIECVQIGDEHELSRMSHYVAGFPIPIAPTTAADVGEPKSTNETAFDAFYKDVGVGYMPTVCDGDCGLDVMCIIDGVERTLNERTKLRAELSDYLIQRTSEHWMTDILIVTQELNDEDVKLARFADIHIEEELMPHHAAFDAAVAAIACDDGGKLEPVSEEAMSAMR